VNALNMHSFRFLVTLALASLVKGKLYEHFDEVPKHSSFDFIIIGGDFSKLDLNEIRSDIHDPGSTTGNALANRLTENPLFNVLVLEAGPSYVFLMRPYHSS